MDANGWFKAFGLQADKGSPKAKEGVVEDNRSLLACMQHLLIREVGQGEKQGCEEADKEYTLLSCDKLSPLE